MESLITSRQKLIIDMLPGFWICKDVQSTYSYANQQLAELLGLRHREEAVGMTDLDLPCDAAESAHLFRAQDREVILSGRPLCFLDVHCYGGNQWRTLLFCKSPLRDAQQNIVGIVGYAQELSSGEVMALGVLLGKCIDIRKDCPSLFGNDLSYTIGRPAQSPELSPLQEEVLFLWLRGDTVEQIGWSLDITRRRVEGQLRSLMATFSASSQSELIEKTSALGYRHHLPRSLARQALRLIRREND